MEKGALVWMKMPGCHWRGEGGAPGSEESSSKERERAVRAPLTLVEKKTRPALRGRLMPRRREGRPPPAAPPCIRPCHEVPQTTHHRVTARLSATDRLPHKSQFSIPTQLTLGEHSTPRLALPTYPSAAPFRQPAAARRHPSPLVAAPDSSPVPPPDRRPSGSRPMPVTPERGDERHRLPLISRGGPLIVQDDPRTDLHGDLPLWRRQRSARGSGTPAEGAVAWPGGARRGVVLARWVRLRTVCLWGIGACAPLGRAQPGCVSVVRQGPISETERATQRGSISA